MLHPVDYSKPFELYTDASCIAAGAVLCQGKDCIIDFFSNKYSPTEQRYPVHTLEAYAVCLSILHFKRILLGQEFTVYTDHKSLEHWLLGRPLTERHAKMLVKLEDFSFKIVYVKGEDNVLPDFASRPPNNGKSGFDEVRKELDAAAVTAGIRMDLKFLVREHNDQGFVLEDPRIKEDRLKLKDDIYYYVPKKGDEPVILVPPELRAELIEEVHNLAHMGVT